MWYIPEPRYINYYLDFIDNLADTLMVRGQIVNLVSAMTYRFESYSASHYKEEWVRGLNHSFAKAAYRNIPKVRIFPFPFIRRVGRVGLWR